MRDVGVGRGIGSPGLPEHAASLSQGRSCSRIHFGYESWQWLWMAEELDRYRLSYHRVSIQTSINLDLSLSRESAGQARALPFDARRASTTAVQVVTMTSHSIKRPYIVDRRVQQLAYFPRAQLYYDWVEFASIRIYRKKRGAEQHIGSACI